MINDLSHFEGSQPDNSNDEDYVEMIPGVGWNDRKRGPPAQVVCVRQDLLDYGEYSTSYGEKWMILRSKSMGYDEADSYCQSMGMKQPGNDEIKMLNDLLEQGLWSSEGGDATICTVQIIQPSCSSGKGY